MRPVVLFTALLLATLASFLFSLSSGSVDVGWQELLTAITGDTQGLADRVVIELRWPRAAAAFTTGALLALAGSLMQVLLRNPLADPYVLGVSGGAATGALLALLMLPMAALLCRFWLQSLYPGAYNSGQSPGPGDLAMAKLYFRHGTVGSAKTLNLLAVAHNYMQQNKRAFIIKPELDVRFGRDVVHSRAGVEKKALSRTPVSAPSHHSASRTAGSRKPTSGSFRRRRLCVVSGSQTTAVEVTSSVAIPWSPYGFPYATAGWTQALMSTELRVNPRSSRNCLRHRPPP